MFLLLLKRGTKGYILLNIHSSEIFVSMDIIFYIHIFPYQRVQDTNNKTNNTNHWPAWLCALRDTT